ncbi:MAG: ComEC family competence protein [Rubellimicrobium sp.]|nr:ComEC family competence protein [Rubellimicrobium sp.]
MIGPALLAQRGHLFPWAAVAFGTGIGLWFALRFEPEPAHYGAVLGLGIVALGLALWRDAAHAPLAIGLALIAAGFVVAGARAHLVAAPVLEFRYHGPVQGRVVDLDRSSSDNPRLLLDHVVLDGVAPDRTPAQVRISLTGEAPEIALDPGTVVILTAHLSPPAGPTEPGGFDFRRFAWFKRIGAVGYSRTPILTLIPARPSGLEIAVNRLRKVLSAAIRDRVEGDAGGYAAAVLTGDRSGLSETANQTMRDSNLYHLVSISGAHMTVLVAFVFALVRYGVALVPPVALRVSAKKVAALVALPVAAFYLALAGRDMATERAFVMVAVALGAILLDRQALTLRSVAMAAVIVLALRPEGLMNPGFQMSFAASAALVVVFSEVRALPREGRGLHRVLLPVAALALSSLVAGTASAPYGAANYNRVAHYGVPANLLAGPAMGILVMPGGVLLMILAPIGLERPAVWMVDYGARFILWVAEIVASIPGAVSAVPTPPAAVLPLITFGGAMVMIWQGRGRWIGLAGPLLALVLWAGVERPVLLVADTGGLIGVMGPEGRVLSKPQGDSYAAEAWLMSDGEIVTQSDAHSRQGLETRDRITRVSLPGAELIFVTGQTAHARLDGCDGADILIANVELETPLPCETYDLARLRETGALSGRLREGVLTLDTAAARAGKRLWSTQ